MIPVTLTFASPLTRGFSVFLDAFIEKLDPYVNEVIASPERVEEIVKRLVEDHSLLSLMLVASIEVISRYRVNPREIIIKVVGSFEELREKVSKCSISDLNALDTFIEHDVWKLEMIIENPETFFRTLYGFMKDFPQDFAEYVKDYFAGWLLVIAIDKVANCNKIKELMGILRKYAEDLDAYTTTFQLLMGKQREDLNIEISCKDEKCLQEALRS